MPGQQIKQLREIADLDNALALAETEFRENPDNVWTGRNLSWVLVDILKENTSANRIDTFLNVLSKLKAIGLPANDTVLYDAVCWRVGQMAMSLSTSEEHLLKAYDLFRAIVDIPFQRPSKAFSYLFVAMHKCLKARKVYTEFAEWWDFRHFLPEDHAWILKDSGRTIMSIAEQAYLHYSKCLFVAYPLNPKEARELDHLRDIDKIRDFQSFLKRVAEEYPRNDFIPYLIARMHADLGERELALSSIRNSAKGERNRIWIWKLLAECSIDDTDLSFAFLCRSLSIDTAESNKKNCRVMLAEALRDRGLYDEARTEVDIAVQAAKHEQRFTGTRLKGLMAEEWYAKAKNLGSNDRLYRDHLFRADDYLDGDNGKHSVLVEFVNSRRKILHFITRDGNSGYLKYGRLASTVCIGDILAVRFRGGVKAGLNHALSIGKGSNDRSDTAFFMPVRGSLHIDTKSSYGRIGDVWVHQSIIRGAHLTHGMNVEGTAIKFFNPTRGEFGWKALSLSLAPSSRKRKKS
jgi:hypothetical protein